MLTPDIARMIMSNFDEFYRRGSFAWEHFTEDMKSALASTAGLASPDRWLPRRMTACVCCARMCAALPVNRFRSNYKVLRVLNTFLDLHSKI